MKTTKKTALISALMATGMLNAGLAQAAATDITWTGSFLMTYGDPANTANFDANYDYIGNLNSGSWANYTGINDNGNGAAGDPIHGTFSLDFGAGTGTGTVLADTTFFGSAWTATVVSMTQNYASGTTYYNIQSSPSVYDIPRSATDTVGVNYFPAEPNLWHTVMTFNWGAPAATTCGVQNCDINVAVDLKINDLGGGNYSFTTVGSWMFDGPFATFQPSFSGTGVAAVPVPATAWVVGSGLLGLMGVGRMRKKTTTA